jgi:hypothetical protein
MRTVARRGIARIGANDSQIGPLAWPRFPLARSRAVACPAIALPCQEAPADHLVLPHLAAEWSLVSEASGFAGAKPMAGLAERHPPKT